MSQNTKIPTILITGATGYLGSNILNTIINKGGYKIIFLKRSFSNTFRINKVIDNVAVYNLDEVDIEKIFQDNQIDIILHCATDYGRKIIDPMQIIEANLVLPIKLLECGRKHNVKSFINTDTVLDKRISHYSLSKKQFRDWLLSYKKDMVCINVELEHFYGPGDDKTKFVSYVADLLTRNADKIDLTLGEQKRDFVYIDDIVQAFLKIISHTQGLENGFYEFQVCSGQEITIRELVLMMKDIIGNHKTLLNFGSVPYRENEAMVSSADASEIKKLGWSAKYTLEDGLKKMIEIELVNNKI